MSDSKKCAKCNSSKPLDSFKKASCSKDGLFSYCKECNREYQKQRREKLKVENPEKLKRQSRESYYRRREKILKQKKIYSKQNAERERARAKKWREDNPERTKQYSIDNKEKKKAYDKKRRSTKKHKQRTRELAAKRRKDPLFRLNSNIRSYIWRSLKGNKNKHSEQYLGCSHEEFIKHIESQFCDGMSWDNYGRSHDEEKGWELDHITPIDSANNEQEIIKLWHYTNLQPLWAFENRAKWNRLDWEKN